MSLEFAFGPLDEEVGREVYKKIIEESMQNPGKNYLVIVPDQFTMQTQKQLVGMHPRGGILNIDVLSFGRLYHRIMEETGKKLNTILDDTGKCLVLEKVAASLKDQCPVLGGFLSRQGYIHEVKSMISEFMQYGISVEGVTELIDQAGDKKALQGKLRDLQTIYAGFMAYIENQFITTEEKLDILKDTLKESQIVKDSVVVLHGFTGFTPIQNRLLEELMTCCDRMIVSLVLAQGEDPYGEEKDQELFALTKKTVRDLEKLAANRKVARDRQADIFVPLSRKDEEIAFLTENIFGYRQKAYDQVTKSLQMFETSSPKQEMKQIALEIKKLVQREGYAYRDIAVLMGNLEDNSNYIETEFSRMEIPYFLDMNRAVRLNPLVEFIKSALLIWRQNFSYDSVMHYLRSGLSGFEMSQIDAFDQYLVQAGIKGKSRYEKLFEFKPKGFEEHNLNLINGIRGKLIEDISCLRFEKGSSLRTMVEGLYDFLVKMETEKKLAELKDAFAAKGDVPHEKEYAQIYRYVCDLLDQMQGLWGDEVVSLQEFMDILEAGIGELSLGIIPKQVDRVVVGDMERTRLNDVKILFFAQMNDGVIPRNVSKGGLISDMDREFLQENCPQKPLAPTPRQQMYIQRFYLYLNITKPRERLFLSYSLVGADGKSLRPSYLVREIRKMFPYLTRRTPEREDLLSRISSLEDGRDHLAAGLRDYALGVMPKEREEEFFTLYTAFGAEADTREFLEKTAFMEYKAKMIDRMVARALYGRELTGSVSRLETYAQCAFRHFVQYGLTLKERKEFGFESVDMGNLYHSTLEEFASLLETNGKDWFHFDEAFAAEAVKSALHTAIMKNPSAVYSTYRNLYAVNRMERILIRTVLTMKDQLGKGEFVPKAYELSFRPESGLKSTNLTLSEDEKLKLYGRVDRVDLAQTQDRILVKVVDYKSGNKDFDVVGVYYGLSLQLAVYMNVAMELEEKAHPDKEIVPAAMLYYHVYDPVIQAETFPSEEKLREEIGMALRSKGIINEEEEVVYRLDRELEQADVNSTAIPVKTKKDGSFTSASRVMSLEDFGTLSQYVTRKMICMGQEILSGNIDASPSLYANHSACEYCPVRKVCNFDTSIPGCSYRELEALKDEIVMEEMREY